MAPSSRKRAWFRFNENTAACRLLRERGGGTLIKLCLEISKFKLLPHNPIRYTQNPKLISKFIRFQPFLVPLITIPVSVRDVQLITKVFHQNLKRKLHSPRVEHNETCRELPKSTVQVYMHVRCAFKGVFARAATTGRIIPD